IHKRQMLNTSHLTAAAVAGAPGAVDAGPAGAVGRCRSVAKRHGDISAAAVGCSCKARVGRIGRIAALKLPVRWACDRNRAAPGEWPHLQIKMALAIRRSTLARKDRAQAIRVAQLVTMSGEQRTRRRALISSIVVE